jgi:tetratricopeptide (TPR) repeat protein
MTPSPPAKTSKELLDDAKALMEKGDWKNAIELLQAIITQFSKDYPSRFNVAWAFFHRAQCQVHMADLGAAQKDCQSAVAQARDLQDLSIEGQALRLLGNISWKISDYKKAFEYLKQAHEIAKKTNDLRLEGMVHLELGTTYSNTSELDTADHEYRDAILALEKVGDMRELARAYNNFANNFVYAKKFDKAAEMFAKTKKIAERVGDLPLAAWGAFNRAECLVELGASKEALLELDWALPILEKAGDNYGTLGALQIYGLAYAKNEDWVKAEEFLLKARSMAQKNKMPVSEAKVLRDLGRIYKWKGDRAKALQYFTEAKDIFATKGSKRELARVEAEMKDLS